MSERTGNNYSFPPIKLDIHSNAATQRASAVDAALEIIRAKYLGGSNATISTELAGLDKLADSIQAALQQ